MIALFKESKFHHVGICERVKPIMLLKEENRFSRDKDVQEYKR